MKTALTAQQIVYFRQNGHIRFEPSPIDFATLEKPDNKERDLWRASPSLKKIIEKKLATLALELTGRKQLRIGCDQWIAIPFSEERLQNLFCMQGIVILAALSEHSLDFFDPSILTTQLILPSYLVLFTHESARYIDNPKDPYVLDLRRMGYNYGDLLVNEFHPLIFAKS